MLAALFWRDPTFYTFLGLGGAVLLALALGLYALPGSRVKVPGIALAVVGGVGVGVALGVVLTAALGYDMKNTELPSGPPPEAGDGPGAAMAGPGAPGGGRGGRGGRGGGGPNHRAQLTGLVRKLDQLTDKPLEVRLSDEQRKKLKELLAGLDTDEMSEGDATEKLQALLAVLADQKDTLTAAGYNWPAEGGGRGGRGGLGGGRGPGGGGGRDGGGAPSNPFKAEDNARHLKSLEDKLDKPAKG